jgi:general secretion pathway protein H
MSAMVAPRLSGMLAGVNLKTSVRKVAAALRYARSQAVTKGHIITVCFDSDKGVLYISNQKEDSRKSISEIPAEDGLKKTILLKYKLPSDIKIEKVLMSDESPSDGKFLLYFYPSGSTSGCEIYIAGMKHSSYVIKVDVITGSVHVTG